MTQQPPSLSSLFELEYPQSVGIYDSYPLAQKAVDFLADNKFAVENLAIVGTDLRSVERVTGRKNWGTVLMAGVQSGVSTGLMVALIMWFLQPAANPLALLPTALLIGIVIGVAFAAIGYAMARGRRDFTSISQTVATKYEVLCEHKVAAQARELLRQVPGARAAQFDPNSPAYPAPAGQPMPPTGYAGPASQSMPPAGYAAPADQSGYGYQPSAPYQPAAPSAPHQAAYGQQTQHSYGEPQQAGSDRPGTDYANRPATDDSPEGRTPRGES